MTCFMQHRGKASKFSTQFWRGLAGLDRYTLLGFFAQHTILLYPPRQRTCTSHARARQSCNVTGLTCRMCKA